VQESQGSFSERFQPIRTLKRVFRQQAVRPLSLGCIITPFLLCSVNVLQIRRAVH